MTDMLVNLYLLSSIEIKEENDVTIRKVVPPEKHLVVDWVRQHFSDKWASECEVACSVTPSNCFIAIKNNQISGFACFDTTFRNFFGPTGVKQDERGNGIGYRLLIESLIQMKQNGYAYAIIGDAGPIEFYKNKVGAIPIDNTPVLNTINYLD
ncbi:GNAT family N-acetyltransferase [Gracilibacillus kekensis]|uniref:N-acetyltransferase domain-containing protein n=1 Tax=Gracilibacillus kekensis TaxID=1027249 RepID=A0A1M7QSK8_9BACI|nr:GNAT family N-acetyltransferase [Gracilibacillus kekensis]SHN34744.1 hypothetical protein SAMN05216179_3536 [Gracilibacillus kekensis]